MKSIVFLSVALAVVVAAIVVLADRSGDPEETTAVSADSPAPLADAEPAEDPAAAPPATAVGEDPAAAATGDVEVEAPAEPTSTPTPEWIPRRLSMAFTGELLSHGGLIERARVNGNGEIPYDYRPMFEQVKPILSAADLAICHQETPISSDNTALSGYPIFNAPTELADAIAWAGWDACSTASNHSLDRGFAGVTSTLDQLDRVGVGHAGMARTEVEATTPSVYDVGEVSVGHLSFTYGLNGFPLPAEAPWAVDVIDADAILAEAAAAKEAGADIVVMSVQWGAEYQRQPIEAQTTLAEQVLASPDVDLIVGAHVHVPQPMDRVGDEYVLYGLGNFVSNQSPVTCASCPQATEDGMILWVEYVETAPDEWEVDRIEVIPTWVDRRTYTVIPVSEALADPDTEPTLVPQLEGSWNRTVEAVQSLGAPLPRVEFSPFPPGTPAVDEAPPVDGADEEAVS